MITFIRASIAVFLTQSKKGKTEYYPKPFCAEHFYGKEDRNQYCVATFLLRYHIFGSRKKEMGVSEHARPRRHFYLCEKQITSAYAPPQRGEMRRSRITRLHLDGPRSYSRLPPPGGFLEIVKVSGTDWAYESPRTSKSVTRREGPDGPSRKIDLRLPLSPHCAQVDFPSPNSPRSIPRRRISGRAIPRGFRKLRGLADGCASRRVGGVQFWHVYRLGRGICWRGIRRQGIRHGGLSPPW